MILLYFTPDTRRIPQCGAGNREPQVLYQYQKKVPVPRGGTLINPEQRYVIPRSGTANPARNWGTVPGLRLARSAWKRMITRRSHFSSQPSPNKSSCSHLTEPVAGQIGSHSEPSPGDPLLYVEDGMRGYGRNQGQGGGRRVNSGGIAALAKSKFLDVGVTPRQLGLRGLSTLRPLFPRAPLAHSVIVI